MRAVPVARRNLFAERRRAVLGIAGVGAALLMVLALDGIFAGAMRQVTRYIDTSGTDVFVSQRGVRTMHMSFSQIPLPTVEEIRDVPGVRRANPILYDSGTLVAGRNRELTYLIGYATGHPGGPATLTRGREPGPGGIVLDEEAARSLGIGIGDRVNILRRSWTVSGLVSGMTNIVNTVSYVRFANFARARGTEGRAGYVLVDTTGSAATVARRIQSATGLTAQTRGEFTAQERRGIRDMSADLLRIMTIASFIIGVAVIGLTLYAATLSRLREIGVMKALGASTRRLARDVVSQAGWTVGLALLLAWLGALGLGWVIGRTGAALPLVVEADSVARAVAGAVVLGATGAVVPLVRVSRVDPATVFRRQA